MEVEESEDDSEGRAVREFVIGWKASYWPEDVAKPRAKVDPYYRKENEVKGERVRRRGRVGKGERLAMED